MIGFEQTEWIARPPEAVFGFLSDMGNVGKVMPAVVRVEKLSPGPLGAGTRYRETRLVNGREAQAELEVAHYEPPARYSMRNVTAGVETVYHYTFSPEGDGTRVRLVCELSAGGLKKLLLPLLASLLKREDGDHLARLKRAVEA